MDTMTEALPRPDFTIRLPFWLVRAEDLASAELTGEVLRETARAWQVRVIAVVREQDHCLRCGHEIENPVSRLAGYGPWCSEKLGIPRNFDPADIAAIREAVKVNSVKTMWLPKSKITLVSGELRAPEVPRGTEQQYGDAQQETATKEPPAVQTVTLKIEGDTIQVFSPFRLKDAIKALPGRKWNAKGKCWTLPATVAAAQSLAELAANHACRLVAEGDAERLVASAHVQRDAVVHKTADDLPPVPSRTEAWNHQRQAFWFTKDLDAAMLAMDMGTGKSKVAVDVACARGHQRVLIIAPRSVLGVWPREFDRHAQHQVNVVAPRKGTIAKRAAAISEGLAENVRTEVPVVAVVNYEAAWRSPLAELLLETKWDLVILDESHRIKAPGGKASMFVARLRRSAKQRLCLTGTPMPHSPLDVYAQYRFLDPGIFGTSFAAFRARYAVMGGYGGHEVLGYQRQDELASRMYGIGYRVMADDVLDLPPAVHERRTTELSPKARKVYDSLAKSLFAEVESGQVTAANALVRLLRLQQVTSGTLPVDDSEVVEVIDTAKRDLLGDVLEDLPATEPVVVFCRFTHDLDSVREVCEKQGRRYGELSGRRKDGLTENAEMSEDIDVIGVQIQSGGVGIDLTRARYCIFHSVGFSLGDYEQALKRTHRPGQERSVIYVHLIVEDTVDVKVHEALRERKDLVEHVLGLG